MSVEPTSKTAGPVGAFAPAHGSGFLLDKHGREILVGDVLKIFHFVAAVRHEKRYMYKHVVGREMLGTTKPVPALKISHLNLKESGYYRELLNGRQLQDYEIVQGYGSDGVCFKDRPKRGQNNKASERAAKNP
jgi:hypothetical protein